MKIVVTGGAGFIGSHLSEALLARGHQVLILDNLASGHRHNVPDRAELAEVDILSDAADEALRRFAPEAVFHLAAQMDVRKSVADPVFDAQTNVLGTVKLLAAAVASGCKAFVFASTGGAIYGDHDTVPTPEGAAPRSESPYGISKLCGEHYIDYFARSSELRGVALRFGNVYGPRQDPHGEAGVVAIFSERMLAGQTPTIFGDGRQTRDYVYVGDVVRANLAALESTASGAFNIGTAIETDVNELAKIVAKHANFADAIPHSPGRPGEQKVSCLDIGKAQAELGWSPETTLEDGLKATVAWFKDRAKA